MMRALEGIALAAFALSMSFAMSHAGAREVSPSGSVDALEGTAVVVRGADTSTLALGDKIFVGDRVLTRSDGHATISVLDCKRVLEPSQSILIDQEFCTKAAIALGQGNVVLASAAPGGGAVAASPSLLLPLLGGSSAAAAAAAVAANINPANAPASP